MKNLKQTSSEIFSNAQNSQIEYYQKSNPNLSVNAAYVNGCFFASSFQIVVPLS